MPESSPSPNGAEILRDRPLPDANTSAFLDQLTRLGMAGDEVRGVQDGRVPLLVFSIDQLSAVVLVTYLQHARAQIGPDAASDLVAERIALDLERMIGVDCPELARLLAVGRAKGKTGGRK